MLKLPKPNKTNVETRPKFSTAFTSDFTSVSYNIVQILSKSISLWLQPSYAKINPYNSQSISVRGTALCNVMHKNRIVPIEVFVLPRSCQSILDSLGQLT